MISATASFSPRPRSSPSTALRSSVRWTASRLRCNLFSADSIASSRIAVARSAGTHQILRPERKSISFLLFSVPVGEKRYHHRHIELHYSGLRAFLSSSLRFLVIGFRRSLLESPPL